ncbi:hypothetical protein L484_010704 [Morus notabilis]|uniref:Uncharacterized protein n=1 Tax=Morus notabilis TaxID=981085 RepID=W9RR57_9ROSA|nr:hypothetical protein L484_010704 [Morus notabilis]
METIHVGQPGGDTLNRDYELYGRQIIIVNIELYRQLFVMLTCPSLSDRSYRTWSPLGEEKFWVSLQWGRDFVELKWRSVIS